MSFGFGFGLPSQLYLIGSPTLNLNLAGATVLDPIVTFTRASSASYYNSLGLLSTATTNTPRFDYNPATLAAQGLLIEEQRTNLLTYSSEFDNAAWTKTNATISANVIASPDGNVNADKLVEDTANSTHYARQTIAGTVNTAPITISVYVKAAGRTYVGLAIQEATTFTRQTNVVFDLTNVVAGTPSSLGGAGSASATITNVGNGWYRCTLTTTLGGTDTNVFGWIYSSIVSGFTYTGDGVSGIYIYGAQLEAGAFPTSYIPSTNTFTSRASTGSFFDATGTLQSAAINVARNTYNPANLVAAPFLLLEEARTNSIRNSTMVGAIAGTPGTLPTNWSFPSPVGLSYSVVNIGTEDGISYIDLRVFGTTAGTGTFLIFESVAPSASQNQTWTASSYVKLVSGSLTNIATTRNIVVVANSGGVTLSAGSTNITPTTQPLRTQRGSTTYTIPDATAAFAYSRFDLTFSSGVAIDITLRIGLPQFEQGYGATSVIPNSPTFTSRASAATYYNSAGLLTSAATNVARYNYNPANLTQPANLILENAATNLLTYTNEFDNAAWTKGNATVSANVITSPTGNVDADALIENTTASAFHYIYQAITKAAANVQYAWSFFVKNKGRQVEVTMTSGAGANGVVGRFNPATGLVITPVAFGTGWTVGTLTVTALSDGWYRVVLTATSDTATTATAQLSLNNGTTNTYTGDGVSGIYIYGAQLETGAAATTYVPSTNTFTSRASTGTYFDSAGVLQSAAINVARNTYNPANLSAAPFLLLEEARTNSIRNSTMVGAIAGTPGTLPTNWVIIGAGLGTLTQQIVGISTSAGIPYIDIRLSGTTSTTAVGYSFESGTQISASVGQTWTNSFYIARVAGSNTNISSIQARVIDRDIGGANIGASVNDFLSSLTTSFTRPTVTRTLAGVGTAFVSPDIFISFSSGVAIDITLRIGLPQLEQGAFATSVIPTTTTALTRSADVSSSATTTRAADVYSQGALTRSADVSSSAQATRAADLSNVNTLSPWYNASEGTLYVESDQYIAGFATAQYTGAELGDGTNNNLIQIATQYGASNYQGLVNVGGVAQAVLLSPSGTSIVKRVLGYKVNDFAMSINGQAVITDTSGSVPTVTSFGIGMRPSGIGQLNGHVRRITYYPRRLSNTELQSLTT